MTKTEFLSSLRHRLAGLPEDYIEETLLYYSEIIDDYTEDGLTEEEAVLGLGDTDTIAALAGALCAAFAGKLNIPSEIVDAVFAANPVLSGTPWEN